MENKQKSFLIDNTKCIGCRGCQVACKQWNNLEAEKTEFFGGPGYQNPSHLSEKTFTLVKFHEVMDGDKLKDWVFWKNQCQHCLEPACIDSCLGESLHKTENGSIVSDEKKCIGCLNCKQVCPFDIPKFEWNKEIAVMRKCNFCDDRITNGDLPACAKTCPTQAILFGEREEMIKIAKHRLQANPEKYPNYIYGLNDVGGTGVINISSVPLEELGYPKNLPTESLGSKTKTYKQSVPSFAVGLCLVLGATAFIINRRMKVNEQENEKGDQNE